MQQGFNVNVSGKFAAALEGARAFIIGLRKQANEALSRLPPPVAGALPVALCGVVAAGVVLAVVARRARRAAASPRAAPSPSPVFNEYEKLLLGDLVRGEDMEVTFDSIGGLAGPIADLEELVILPLSHPELYSHSSLLQNASGVLLMGPPGTGKTLLAKAIARGTRATFLSVNVASLQSKWFGETPKIVEAIFSLAQKVSPCVVFVDEADGLLAARSDVDASHVNTMKTKFLEAWDGIKSIAAAAKAKREGGGEVVGRGWVLVVGATNKPWALDPAVLRRMPRQITVPLPDREGRRDILAKLLRGELVAEGLPLGGVAAATEGYSGSDLKELVKAAVLLPIRETREAIRARRAAVTRPLEERDLLAALAKVKPTGDAATAYQVSQLARAFAGAAGEGGAGAPVFIPGRSMRNNSAGLSQHVQAARGRGGASSGGGSGSGSSSGGGGGGGGGARSPTSRGAVPPSPAGRGRGGGGIGSPRTSPRRQP